MIEYKRLVDRALVEFPDDDQGELGNPVELVDWLGHLFERLHDYDLSLEI